MISLLLSMAAGGACTQNLLTNCEPDFSSIYTNFREDAGCDGIIASSIIKDLVHTISPYVDGTVEWWASIF